MDAAKPYEAIVLGTSAGGTKLLKSMVAKIPAGFSLPLIVVQHIGADSDGYWIRSLDKLAAIKVKEADEKEKIEAATMYVAPANYHLLVERDRTLTLTVSEPVNYARPSIDVLFETAADAFKNRLIGVVLSGYNSDGAVGLKRIKENGGLTIVQAPETCEAAPMPKAAIKEAQPDYTLPPDEIYELLIKLAKNKEPHTHETKD
ncbi:chemotaxis protein CheB [Fulvivirga kasyanovii]|uniref:protein-glutamate methylesterase n=1 Tax=Fulvivirga kasyanovii TaxID=396812 RepID=A0ABW9S0I5_9BACT|nr:chemotaxis protein CheB [Fulvivirga kasyanovii]MTI29148.1 chemotaxis protein CheB [Fulvivirga kasyanovii]